MAIEIRKMTSEEAPAVKKLAKEIFDWFEALFVPNPEKGFVAYEGERLLGSVLYKYFTVGALKIGYVDFIFVDKAAHGQGLGNQLLVRCVESMWADGCDGLSAIVQSDNVGSWSMFLKQGFSRVGASELYRYFGFSGMVNHFIKTPMYTATGMEYYLILKNQSIESRKNDSIDQLRMYLIYTCLFLLPSFIRGTDYASYLIGSIVTILVVRAIGGYIGTLLTKESWHFRVTDGGFLPPLIAVLLGGLYVMAGNWYPNAYRKEPDFKRSLGLSAFTQWLSLLGLRMLVYTSFGNLGFVSMLAELAGIMMIIQVIPVYPISPFGGKRMMDWNKGVFVTSVLISVALLFIPRETLFLLNSI